MDYYFKTGGALLMPDPIPNTPGRQELVDLYMTTLSRLKNIVYSVDTSSALKRRAAQKIVEIQNHIKSLKKSNVAWIKKYIPAAYERGSYADEKILEKWKGNAYQGQFSTLHRDAAMIAAEAAIQDFKTIADVLEQTYVGYIRRVQVAGAQQAIAREIGSGIIEGASRRTVSNRLVEELKNRAINGIIQVGNANLNVTSYADLLARTVTRAAVTEGTLNRLKENGCDLVIFNNTGAVDFCRAYEDQIFSLSGKDSRFPVLQQRPPLHINCTHSIHAFIEAFAEPDEVDTGTQFPRGDNGKSAKEMAKKYPVIKDDTRAMTKKSQRAA